MIEKLKEKDIKETAKIHNKGLRMQIPKGHSSLDKTIKNLKKVHVFVYKENKKIKGVILFKLKQKNKITINFICALTTRRGIGKKLIKKLVNFPVKEKIEFIYSNVSSKDERAMNFYKKCGFKIYKKCFLEKNFMLYKIKAKPEWVKKAIK